MTQQKIQIKISGIHCAACAQTIEKALLKAEGVAPANLLRRINIRPDYLKEVK